MNITNNLTPVNFTKGRGGKAVRNLVLHSQVGNNTGSLARFKNPAAEVSANFLIGLNGSIIRVVSENDTAWHAGLFAVNQISIGLEFEDNGNHTDAARTPEMYQAGQELIAALCKTFNIPAKLVAVGANKIPVEAGIVVHNQIKATACPSGLDRNRLVNGAAAIIAGGNPTPPPVVNPEPIADYIAASGTVRVTIEDGMKVRTGPGTSYAVNPTHTSDGVLQPGETFEISGYKHAQDIDLSGVPGGKHTDVWVRSRYGNWVSAAGLDFNAPAPTPPPAPEPVPAPTPAPTPAPGPSYEAFLDADGNYANRRFKISKDGGTEVWAFGNAKKWDEITTTGHVDKGTEFIAAGLATHPLGGKYYMSQGSMGEFNKTGKVTLAVGVNVKDVEDYVEPTPPVEPPTPDWQTETTAKGTFRATEDLVVVDFEDKQPDVELHKGQLFRRATTFVKDGTTYARSENSVKNGAWYGVPENMLIPAPDPDKFVGPLISDVTTGQPESSPDIEEDLTQLSLEDEIESFKKSLSSRERLVVILAKLQALFLKLNPGTWFKKKK